MNVFQCYVDVIPQVQRIRKRTLWSNEILMLSLYMFTRAIGTFNEFFFNKISILFRYLLPTFMFNIPYYLILTTKKCTTKNVLSMFHEIYDLYLLSEKLNINFTFLKEFPPILIITSLGRSLATSFWYIIHNHENQSFITKF